MIKFCFCFCLGYLENNKPEKALDIFETLLETANDVSYIIAFHACASLRDERSMKLGKRLIREMPIVYKKNPAVLSSMLKMLMTFGQVEEAEQLFLTIEKKTLKNYEVMMQSNFSFQEKKTFKKTINLHLFLGYVDDGMADKALDMFEQLSVPPDNVLLTILFRACASLGHERAIQLGNRVYRDIRTNDKNDNILLGSMLHMLMKFGQVKDAENLFSQIKEPTVQICGVMMHGYNTNRQPRSSWTLFQTLKQKGLTPDAAVFFGLINAAALIGMQSFCHTVVDQLPSECRNNIELQNALINMWVCSS